MNKLPNIFIYPGKLYATKINYHLSTILGSCVAVCLWDKKQGFGGMNHFMLPYWNGQGLASPKYGNIAIDKLIQRMKYLGSKNEDLVAKIFGGGKIMESTSGSFSIGERNIEIAQTILREKNIKIIKSSIGGERGRKIMLNTTTFEVYHKFIEKSKQA